MGSQDDQVIDPYAQLPELYDLEHGAYDEDIPFYLQTVESVGDPVVELGCGTGRILLPIADAGFRITGVDCSGPMLDVARSVIGLAGLELQVTLLETGMTDLAAIATASVGTVLIPLNGLMHLATSGEQRTTLTEARRILDPRGQLVIDVLNPVPMRLQAWDRQVVHEGTWTREDGAIVDKFSARRVDHAEQRIDTELWYDITTADHQVQRVRSSFPMRYLSLAELTLMLEFAGFGDLQVYGSYDLDAYHDDSERLLVTAEPR